VENQNFSIDARKSEKGVTYIFKSDGNFGNLQALNDAFGRFDSFMKLCGDDPSQAESILKDKGLKEQNAVFLVERYSRDYRRLILDTKHEFERKSLILRQRLETDIVEVGTSPTISWLNESLSSLISAAATGTNVAVNIGNISVVNSNKVHTEIEHLINGSISYNDNDRFLLKLFSCYADRLEALQCRSDLDQLKDSSTPEPARQNAKQRLVGFLRKSAQKVGGVAEHVAVKTLSEYLESILKGGI
jgi:hypothetical protein